MYLLYFVPLTQPEPPPPEATRRARPAFILCTCCTLHLRTSRHRRRQRRRDGRDPRFTLYLLNLRLNPGKPEALVGSLVCGGPWAAKQAGMRGARDGPQGGRREHDPLRPSVMLSAVSFRQTRLRTRCGVSGRVTPHLTAAQTGASLQPRAGACRTTAHGRLASGEQARDQTQRAQQRGGGV